MLNYTLHESNIPIRVYQQMRKACGLSEKTSEAARIGLANSLHAILLKEGETVIAMGRIIGDGGCFCQVVDICVHPAYQGRGLSKVIMRNLLDFIEKQLPSSCYVSLIADGNASYLYEKFGFKATMPASKGMYLKKD